jgi:hypothetical protein
MSVQFHLLAATVIGSAPVTLQATGFKTTNFLDGLNNNRRREMSCSGYLSTAELPTSQLFVFLHADAALAANEHYGNVAFIHELHYCRQATCIDRWLQFASISPTQRLNYIKLKTVSHTSKLVIIQNYRRIRYMLILPAVVKCYCYMFWGAVHLTTMQADELLHPCNCRVRFLCTFEPIYNWSIFAPFLIYITYTSHLQPLQDLYITLTAPIVPMFHTAPTVPTYHTYSPYSTYISHLQTLQYLHITHTAPTVPKYHTYRPYSTYKSHIQPLQYLHNTHTAPTVPT